MAVLRFLEKTTDQKISQILLHTTTFFIQIPDGLLVMQRVFSILLGHKKKIKMTETREERTTHGTYQKCA